MDYTDKITSIPDFSPKYSIRCCLWMFYFNNWDQKACIFEQFFENFVRLFFCLFAFPTSIHRWRRLHLPVTTSAVGSRMDRRRHLASWRCVKIFRQRKFSQERSREVYQQSVFSKRKLFGRL